VTYGAAYGFEIATAGGWQPATGPMPFAAWGVILPPGQTSTFRVRVPANLEPGPYRISKGARGVEPDGSLMPEEVARLSVCTKLDPRFIGRLIRRLAAPSTNDRPRRCGLNRRRRLPLKIAGEPKRQSRRRGWCGDIGEASVKFRRVPRRPDHQQWTG
jgi:hypothetical protein